jgi:AcrR family transcriptional regulator
MPHKRMTRAERAARTRELLMSAASKVCAKRGLERASIDEVAEEAGFTKGAFYANFRSKEELFLAMLDERFGEHLERLDKTLAGESELEDQAREAAIDFAHLLAEDPEWVRLYFQFAAHAARDEDFRQELVTRNHAVRARVAEVFRRRIDRLPVSSPFAPEELARMADAMADGFAMHQLLDPKEFDEALYGTMWSIFAAGLRTLAVEGADAEVASSAPVPR